MAVFQIGRLFADYDVDIRTSAWAGRRWTVSGDVVLSGNARVDQGIAIREQILGMDGNPDEPFVAVQWSEEPNVNGFYWLLGIRCEAGQMHLTDGLLSWSAELERVSGSEFPPLESHGTWQLTTNTRGVTSGSFTTLAVPQWAVPGTATEFGPVSGTVSGSGGTGYVSPALTLAPGFGSIRQIYRAVVPSSGIYGWSVDPSEYYYGACRVTMDIGSAGDQLVLGRRAADLYTWEVSNGLVRFWLDSTDDTIHMEQWQYTSGVWNQPNGTNFRLEADLPINYHTMTILRNSPECVAIRLECDNQNTNYPTRVYVDLTILRGSSVVYGYMSVPQGATHWDTLFIFRVQTTPSVASTAITGGFRATTADAQGMQFFIVTGSPACTDTLATGRTATTADTTSLSFAIGAERPSTGSFNHLEFFARRAETTRVVAR